MAKGYRIGQPEESIAWEVMNFEYEELSNWTTLLDLADFLGIRVPGNSDEAYNHKLWNQVLYEFKRRYGRTRGIWICRKKSEAIYYYGEYGGDVYEITYDPGRMIIDLGADGIFVIEPFSVKEIGVVPEKHPSAYRDKNPRRARRPRWVSRNPHQRPQNGKPGGFLHPGDRSFIEKKLKPYFGIAKLRIGWSDSKAVYPDIWCDEVDGIPRITVTREWQRQDLHERRKRLVHEAIHIAWKKNHGIVEGYEYSTIPAKDIYSWVVYQGILKRKIPEGVTRLNRNPGRGKTWYRGAPANEDVFNKPYSYWSSDRGVALSYAKSRQGKLITAVIGPQRLCKIKDLELGDRMQVIFAMMAGKSEEANKVAAKAMRKIGCDAMLLDKKQMMVADPRIINISKVESVKNPRRMGPPWEPVPGENDEEDILVGVEF